MLVNESTSSSGLGTFVLELFVVVVCDCDILFTFFEIFKEFLGIFKEF